MVCTKKNLFMTNEPFWARKWHALTEKTIWEVYFKYTLRILHLYFRPLKPNRIML